MKKIDFETLCEIIHLQCDPNCDGLINHCPIWNSLPYAEPTARELLEKMFKDQDTLEDYVDLIMHGQIDEIINKVVQNG